MLALCAAAVALLIVGFSLGTTFRDLIRPSLQSLTGSTRIGETASALSLAPLRLAAAWLRPADVEKIIIDVKFKHFEQIRLKRKQALEQGLLISEEDDMVPAEIRYGGRTVRIKLRLKGDLSDHLAGDKWSFRIHVRGGDALFGMRRFSIQAPATRGFQSEPLFLAALRDEGVLAPRYSFIEATINGRDMGVMALEEFFSKELLESQRRREGVILKFDESAFWANLLENGSHGPYENYRVAPIDAFGESKIQSDPALASQFAAASGLLRGFIEGSLSASDAFDEELLGRFLAVCETWGSIHAVRWHNLRFYFNPVDRELEPIGFDGNLQAHYFGNRLLVSDEPIGRAFLEDPGVRAAYVRTLRRLSQGLVDGSLPNRWAQREAPYLRVLHREFPARAPIDWNPLVARAYSLRAVDESHLESFEIPVTNADSGWPKVVDAVAVATSAGWSLELRNPLPYPVVVDSIEIEGRTGPESAIGDAIAELPVELPATPRGSRPEVIRIALPSGLDATAVEGGVRARGTARVGSSARRHDFVTRPSGPAIVEPLLPSPSVESLLAQHAFLERDESDGFLRVIPGEWAIQEPLILPVGSGLRVSEGTTLRFAQEASLVARGPLEFLATRERPIVLEPLAGPAADSEAEATWRGVVVLGAAGESRWRHVDVRSTRSFRLGDWELTGGVTFFESNLHLERCSFIGHRGEDALNAIRSRIELVDLTFRDTPSDAFDGDFVEGRIEGGLFKDVGGDGVDVSGSSIIVSRTRFENIHDKAISVGEGSRLVAEGVRVDGAGTGMASKDRSEAEVRDSVFERIEHVTLMAYAKKREFGSASLVAERIQMEGGVEQQALAQKGSRVSIDGVFIPERKFDADRVYEEGYMKK